MHTLTPHEFVSKWKQVTAREQQTYQEHFLDLCYQVGHQTPNVRSTWLDLAHKRLDAVIFAAHGWKSDLRDEEIPEKLLALYHFSKGIYADSFRILFQIGI